MSIIKILLEIILSLVMISGNYLGIANLIKKDVEVPNISKIQEETTISNVETKETPKVVTSTVPKTTQSKPTVATPKQETVTIQKQEPIENKQSTPTPIVQEQPVNSTPTAIPEKPKETFEPNYEMIETLKQAIRNNESDYMKTYGYEIVVDSSIKGKTTGFTYTELRIKPMIKYSFGTIRIYAENYYVGGQLIMVNCYIL